MDTQMVKTYLPWIFLAMVVVFNIYWFLIRSQVTVIDVDPAFESGSVAQNRDTETQREQYVVEQKEALSELEPPVIEEEEIYIDSQLLLLQQLEKR